VVIPEIVGVNVPDPNAGNETALVSSAELETQYDNIVRNSKSYLLETVVSR